MTNIRLDLGRRSAMPSRTESELCDSYRTRNPMDLPGLCRRACRIATTGDWRQFLTRRAYAVAAVGWPVGIFQVFDGDQSRAKPEAARTRGQKLGVIVLYLLLFCRNRLDLERVVALGGATSGAFTAHLGRSFR